MSNDKHGEPSVKKRILVIGGEHDDFITLTHILSPDYTLYTAKNGQNGIEIARSHLPDLILLNVLMPEMDGYEVITKLKGIGETSAIPVIFISGLTSPADDERGIGLGAAEYIGKPFSPPIVKLRIQNQLQMQSQIETIRQLSLIDPLTGIPNRRSLDQRLRLEWNHAKRDQAPLSLLMMDIDKFKQYNDTHGPLQGDAALTTVAKVLGQSLKRASDFAARWGGEEFAVLLPHTDISGAKEVAETIRKNIAKTHVPATSFIMETSVTISIGINSMMPRKIDSLEDFINGADQALHNAKNQGRNRVCVYGGNI